MKKLILMILCLCFTSLCFAQVPCKSFSRKEIRKSDCIALVFPQTPSTKLAWILGSVAAVYAGYHITNLNNNSGCPDFATGIAGYGLAIGGAMGITIFVMRF